MEPVYFLDLGSSGIGWMDGIGTRIVRRDERDEARYGLEDCGVLLGEDKVSEKSISGVGRRDGRCIGIELYL
jgi:hypothetical protein